MSNKRKAGFIVIHSYNCGLAATTHTKRKAAMLSARRACWNMGYEKCFAAKWEEVQ